MSKAFIINNQGFIETKDDDKYNKKIEEVIILESLDKLCDVENIKQYEIMQKFCN